MPTHDWQFWAVTALGVAAAAYLLRQVVVAVRSRAGRSKRATLTVRGRPVDRPLVDAPRRAGSE